MPLKYGKKHLERMIDTLEDEHETVTDAAKATLDTAEQVFEERASFVVVGQLMTSVEHGDLDPSDPEAIKVSLGWYSTEGDAEGAAQSLAVSNTTGDVFRTWILPVHHGTPADLHKKQREKYQEAERKRNEKRKEKFQESIRKRQEEIEERANGGKGSCKECGHHPYDHSSTGNGRGRCLEGDCECPQWEERKK